MRIIGDVNNSFILEQKNIPTRDIYPNDGQITGLPANPRYIDEKGVTDLKRSIEEDPEFLFARPLILIPYAGKYVVLGGNMRLRCCVDLNILEVPSIVLNPDTPIQKLKALVIKDNVSFGRNDWDMLANDWDQAELENWGMVMPFLEDDTPDKEPDETAPTFKLTLDCGHQEPVYNALKIKIAALLEHKDFKGSVELK